MPLRAIFIDMNSFFASVEQQDDHSLRGKPVAVIPTDTDATACIAASYEAKAFGVKTGTPVWEARKKCPGIIFRVARHQRYVIMHHRIVDAVGSCLPVDRVMSIDEMVCRLLGDERRPARVTAIARQIKAAIRERAGDSMRCSIGVGPNDLLAKVAADMQKPDGLVVLADEELPHALHRLELTDFPGVGPRMERRLKLMGVFTVEQFCRAPAKVLADVWGSKQLGEKWSRLLRGEDVPERPGRRQTVSHSHVLPPELRTDAGAYGILVRLTHKATARMRKIGYWAGAVSVGVRYQNDPPGEPGGASPRAGWNGYGGKAGWGAGCRFPHRQDTQGILQIIADLWKHRPVGGVPFQVGMVLADLLPAASATPSLFEGDRKAAELSHAMDDVNREFGANVVYFGSMYGMQRHAPNRISFTQIPDLDRDVS